MSKRAAGLEGESMDHSLLTRFDATRIYFTAHPFSSEDAGTTYKGPRNQGSTAFLKSRHGRPVDITQGSSSLAAVVSMSRRLVSFVFYCFNTATVLILCLGDWRIIFWSLLMLSTNPEERVKEIAQPMIVANILDYLLYGIIILQVYTYYLSFPNDRRWQKALVYSLFVICTFQTILQMRDMITQFGKNFGNPNTFSQVYLGEASLPLVTGIVSCTVQLFYAYQIYVISQSKILAGSITFLSAAQMFASLAQTIRAFQSKDYQTLRQRTYVPFTMWLAGSALCDVFIALVMTFYLLGANSGFRRTYAPLRKLLRLIVETGIASATFASLACIIFLAAPAYNVHRIFMKTLVNLYVNTLLVILNGRIWVAGGREERRLNAESISISTISASTSNDARKNNNSGSGVSTDVSFPRI